MGDLVCQANVCVQADANNSTNNPDNNNPDNNANNPNANNPNNPNNGFTGVGLGVTAADARSCELVISDPEEVLNRVNFDDAVEGRFIPRGQRTAIVFYRKMDEGLADGQVTLEVRGGEEAIASLSVSVAYCFDRNGVPIDDASISILNQ